MDSLISLESAVKDYGERTIGPLTFSVEKGEVVGLLGPNGSGKSTSIRLILGLARPSSGRVSLMGRDPLRDHVRALASVGYSPELPNLQTFLTPKEFLELVGRMLLLKKEEASKQISTLLEDVGLIEYADYKIGRLSKGMVQRLSVAQAMMGSPSVLILDEPMIGIDPAGVVHFRSVLKGFVAGGGTIVISSHIMSEVESLCSSVVVVHSGKLVFRGTTEDFIRHSLNSRIVQVELDSCPDSLLTAISSLRGVISVARTEKGLELETEKGVDVRAELSKLVVESGVGLRALGYSRRELDEAYVAAVRGSS